MVLPGSLLELSEDALRPTNGLGCLLRSEPAPPSQPARQLPDVDQAAAAPPGRRGLVVWVNLRPRERFLDGDALHLRQHLRNPQASAAGPRGLQPRQAVSER